MDWSRSLQGADDTDAASSIQNWFNRGAERLDIDAQRNAWVLRTKLARDLGDHVDGIEDVDDDGQLRFETKGHAFGPGLQQIHGRDDAARVGQEDHAGGGQSGVASRTVEKRHADLVFEIADRLADDGLRAQKLARCGRETPLVDRSNECTQLIE